MNIIPDMRASMWPPLSSSALCKAVPAACPVDASVVRRGGDEGLVYRRVKNGGN